MSNYSGCAPLTVLFNNQTSSGNYTWLWDFGDGDTSSLFSTTHTYDSIGYYVVSLKATSSNGCSRIAQNPWYYVSVIGPKADFDADVVSGCPPLSVNFTDNSNLAASYFWDFGDGATSTAQHPSHVYAFAGVYTPKLIVTSSNGCTDTLIYPTAINVNSPSVNYVPPAPILGCAPFASYFADNSASSQWLWNFGDGTTSTLSNPQHTYTDSGTYVVSLTTWGINGGCERTITNFQTFYIDKSQPGFTYTVSPCPPYVVQFTDTSNNAVAWEWTFSDGSVSTNVTTFKAFYNPGYYDITLIAFENICSDTMTVHNAIYVSRPAANFTYAQSSVCLPVTATFQDLSIDAAQWYWDFGDGATDTVQNPVHIFTSKPVNPITLIIKDVNGCQKDSTKNNIELTNAAFSFSSTGNCNPVTVNFADSSLNPISWLWNFGDGTSSSDASPTHTYYTNGSYDVELTVEAAEGCFSTVHMDSLIVVGQSNADFSADTTNGCLPFLVEFSDMSTNVVNWDWDFGDGSTSSNQNPNHIYTTPGNYTVRLITQNTFGCTDTIIKTGMVNVRGAVPDFSVTSTNGCAPVIITFNNLSTGAISYYWSFGDGSTDSSASVTHSYTNQGNFTASLYAYDSTGCSTIYSYPDPIVVGESPVLDYTVSATSGCSPFAISISDYNTIADSLVWDMGDGTIVTGPHPIYTYQNPGSFLIKLFAYNNGGCIDSLVYPDTIKVYQTPAASFTSNIQIGCDPLPIQFNNTSSNLTNASYYWNFGNQDSSTTNNPYYTYLNSGNFTPYLVVINEGGCQDTFYMGSPIVVYDRTPPMPTSIRYVTVLDNSSVKIK